MFTVVILHGDIVGEGGNLTKLTMFAPRVYFMLPGLEFGLYFKNRRKCKIRSMQFMNNYEQFHYRS